MVGNAVFDLDLVFVAGGAGLVKISCLGSKRIFSFEAAFWQR